MNTCQLNYSIDPNKELLCGMPATSFVWFEKEEEGLHVCDKCLKVFWTRAEKERRPLYVRRGEEMMFTDYSFLEGTDYSKEE